MGSDVVTMGGVRRSDRALKRCGAVALHGRGSTLSACASQARRHPRCICCALVLRLLHLAHEAAADAGVSANSAPLLARIEQRDLEPNDVMQHPVDVVSRGI